MKNDSTKIQRPKLSIKEFGCMLFSYIQYGGTQKKTIPFIQVLDEETHQVTWICIQFLDPV